MKIQFDRSTNRYEVIEPTQSDKKVYLDQAIIDKLEQDGKLNNLEEMDLIIDEKSQRWEISDPIPVGTPGTRTIASIIYAIGGSFQIGESQSERICTLRS